MKRPYWAVQFLSCFSMGIMVPVLSLTLLDKGISLAELALIFGAFSLTVFILEIPSGFLADIAGRKLVFLLSGIFYSLSAVALFFANSVILLIPVIILWGAGKAFASGSLDALIIDAYIESAGEGSIPAVTSRLALIETAGLSAGALFGGFLPGLADSIFPSLGTYGLNLLLRIVTVAAATALCAGLVREIKFHTGQTIRVKQHIVESFKVLKASHVVLLLAVGMFCTGLFLFSIETYWQPVYTALLPAGPDWTLGVLSFGCFLFASLGNILIKRIFSRSRNRMFLAYSIFRLLLFIALAMLAIQRSAAGFGTVFLLLYFMFGGANMAESAILNMEVPCEKRAVMLSFASFVFQAGGLVAPLTAVIASTQEGIRTLWLVLGILFFSLSLIIGYMLFLISRRKAETAVMQEGGNVNTQDAEEA